MRGGGALGELCVDEREVRVTGDRGWDGEAEWWRECNRMWGKWVGTGGCVRVERSNNMSYGSGNVGNVAVGYKDRGSRSHCTQKPWKPTHPSY